MKKKWCIRHWHEWYFFVYCRFNGSRGDDAFVEMKVKNKPFTLYERSFWRRSDERRWKSLSHPPTRCQAWLHPSYYFRLKNDTSFHIRSKSLKVSVGRQPVELQDSSEFPPLRLELQQLNRCLMNDCTLFGKNDVLLSKRITITTSSISAAIFRLSFENYFYRKLRKFHPP